MTKEAFSATGNMMVANAMRQADPDVMAAYPITPQTTIDPTRDRSVRANRACPAYVLAR